MWTQRRRPLVGLARLHIHRLGALAWATIGVEVERIEGEIRDRAAVGRAALNRSEARCLERLLQLMEVPEPMMTLADTGQTDVLRAEGGWQWR